MDVDKEHFEIFWNNFVTILKAKRPTHSIMGQLVISMPVEDLQEILFETVKKNRR